MSTQMLLEAILAGNRIATRVLACVAGVKRGRGRGRGNLGVVSRPNSLPLPFRTPATQAIQVLLSRDN